MQVVGTITRSKGRRDMRARTVIIIVLAALAFVILLAAAALLLYRFNAKNRILDGPGMVREDTFDFSSVYLRRVDYSRGGSSLGDSFSLELTIKPDEDGRPDVRVEYYERETHSAKPKEKTVRVSSNVVSGVTEIIDRYGLRDWGELPPAEMIALDAPSTRLVCKYSDGTSVVLGSEYEIPGEGYDAIREIRDYILRCAGI